MVLNTVTVGTAITPSVVQTFISHYLHRKPLHQKPTAHISYDEGLHLIRKFLVYASHHTVEEIQRFTSQWVPHPHWVKVDEIPIPIEQIAQGATYIQEQLGPHGVEKIGGKTWWQWRRPGSELKAEWIEMREDYNERRSKGGEGKRVMLYVHGGAYFFGSTDEHRYQMQRHARKLKARVFARTDGYLARYRLSPQFPFPCGILDCLAAYLYLLTVQDPTTIVLAGDSAGGGMVLSMLVIMRDRGIPLPAGAILISPWVDLTHSFPSVAEDNPLDYIPPYGFLQRPSPAWPPPNADDLRAINDGLLKDLAKKDHAILPQRNERDAVQGFHVNTNPPPNMQNDNAANGTNHDSSVLKTNTVPGSGRELSIMVDGKLIEIKDQIQMYTTNDLISHPLVSPALQPSLGGLPPLLILTGGGEMLRDEQIYVAHKAANPSQYPPGDAYLDEEKRAEIEKWKPTDVQLQVWDDLCHVAPTLSFTRPAKYMYRSIAQFGAWALAKAQKTEIEILDDDDVSVISRSSESGEDSEKKKEILGPSAEVGKAGDPLPAFKSHMIRQRVNRHGAIFPLAPASEFRACNIPPEDVGVIKEGPVRKWIAAKAHWDTKYAKEKRQVQKRRAKEMAKGYQKFDGETPPPSALAGRRLVDVDEGEEKRGKSWGMWMWSGWGSKHDVKTMGREREADGVEKTVVDDRDGKGSRAPEESNKKKTHDSKRRGTSRSRSHKRIVSDEHQTDDLDGDDTPAGLLFAMKQVAREEENYIAERNSLTMARGGEDLHIRGDGTVPDILVRSPTIERYDEEGELRRPRAGGVAFPFSLGRDGVDREMSASMVTLVSEDGDDESERGGESEGEEDGVENDVVGLNGKGKGVESTGVLEGEKEKENASPAARPEMDRFYTALESPK